MYTTEIIFFACFITFIVGILLLDMLVIDKKAHKVSMKEAGAWTAGWSNWNRGSGVSLSLEMADREEQEWIFQHLVWQAWRRSR